MGERATNADTGHSRMPVACTWSGHTPDGTIGAAPAARVARHRALEITRPDAQCVFGLLAPVGGEDTNVSSQQRI